MPTIGKRNQQKVVPTHLQWFKSKAFKPGSWGIVNFMMTNEDWKTSTFVCDVFKYNMKFSTVRDLEDFDAEVWDYVKDGDHLLVLIDESEPDKSAYGCYLDAMPIPTTLGLELDWDCEDGKCRLITPLEDIQPLLTEILPPSLLPSKTKTKTKSRRKPKAGDGDGAGEGAGGVQDAL